MTRIFDQLSPKLRAIGQQQISHKAVKQICEDYDDVLDTLDRAKRTPGAATNGRIRMLIQLKDELEEEMIQLLQKL